jgi:GT2 family glycosyltransferase
MLGTRLSRLKGEKLKFRLRSVNKVKNVTEFDGEPLVSIIILNYNGDGVLINCLSSVFASNYSNFEVIVVDNASCDGSEKLSKERFPQIELIKNERNLGYCAGNNVGIMRAKGEYIVLLNNDTVVDPDWLKELVKAAKRHPDAAFLQPKILFEENRRVINSAGNMIHIAGFGFCRGIGEVDRGQYDREEEIGYASGACTFARRKAIEEIGLLDSTYFAYNEDADWGWRARLLGWKTIYIPSAKIYHRLGYSWGRGLSKTKMFYIERNRIFTLLKNYSLKALIGLSPILMILEFAIIFYSIFRKAFRIKTVSYSDIFMRRKELFMKRRDLQSRRKGSERDVVKIFEIKVPRYYLGSLSFVLVFLSILKPLVLRIINNC